MKTRIIMASFLRLDTTLRRLKPLFSQQRFCHTVLESGLEADFFAELGPKTMPSFGDADPSKWKKMDARRLGLSLSMIPYASRTVLKILQSEGFEAYLVGGCVRDLLLNKIPKDFDVITSANLQEIKKKFDCARVVGRRFPICRVHVRGSVIEVSSFKTVTRHGGGKEVQLSEMPKGCDDKDFKRWKNSLDRDFTVNSLYYDPFANKVYDYSHGMTDLTAMKLRTPVPAHSSFREDCARILRGLRLAARLGFSFAEDTEKAIQDLYASVKTLDKARLKLEMNYMLSYGSAQFSLLLLKKFNVLEILLPFQAAYLADQSSGQTPVMLMNLFSNLDSVVSCDQPCDSVLWVSILAFHLALVSNPQDALVIWTFSSLLYHGTWKEGVKAARELSEGHVNYAPEISNSFDDIADEELVQRVSVFSSIVLDSIVALTNLRRLCKIMGHCYPSCTCSGVVFISKNAGKAATEIFGELSSNIVSFKKKRRFIGINYDKLSDGDIDETRYVLGKVIIDTMRGGITQSRAKLLTEKKDEFHAPKLKVELGKPNSKDRKYGTQNCKGKAKRNTDGLDDRLDQQSTKKKKQSKKSAPQQELILKKKLGEILSCQSKAKRKKKVEVKDNNFLSLQKEMPLQDAKVEIRQLCEAQPPKEIPSTLEKAPTIAKQHQPLAPNEMLHVQEIVPEKTLSVLENVSKSLKQCKTQAPTDMLNVLKLSNLFEGDEYPSKKYNKPEKKPTMKEQCLDGSRKIKRVRKLSTIFK